MTAPPPRVCRRPTGKAATLNSAVIADETTSAIRAQFWRR